MSKLSMTAISGFMVFTITTLVLHFLQPGYDASEAFVSEFILGKYGWLLNIAIIGNLIGCCSFTIAFYFYHKYYNSMISLLGLVIASLSVLTNFFPTDIHGNAVTLSGYIHNIGAFLGSIAIFPTMLIFSFQLNKLGSLKGIYKLQMLLALLAPLAFIILLLIANYFPEFVGIIQRVYTLIIIGWFITAALKLKSGEF